MTTLGSSRWESTQSASTRTSERLTELPPAGVGTDGREAARGKASDEKVHLAAEAETKGCVKESRPEGERRGNDSDRCGAAQVAGCADHGEGEPHALGEPGRGLGFQLGRGAEPGTDQVT